MKLTKILIIAILAFAFIACNAPEQKKVEDAKPDAPKAEKKEDAKPIKEIAGMDTPTATFKTFMDALKKKDVKKIRASLSKASVEQYEKIAEDSGKTLEEFILSEDDEGAKEIPETRNEKIDGDSATLEAKDPDTKKWDTVPFVKEDGAWKIAFDKLD